MSTVSSVPNEGSAMLSVVLREQGGKELVFFTNSEKNIAFYKKLGFEVFDYRTIAYGGKTMGSWSVKKGL